MYGVIEPNENFPHLTNKNSVLAQCITRERYAKIFWSKTSSGYTIDQAIQIGVDCEDSSIGFLLGDYECIDIFEPLLGPILDQIHPFFDYKDKNVTHIGNLKMIKFDATQTLKDFVIEYAFHLRRNLRGYSLPPHCTRAERREINRILIYILKQLQFDPSMPHYQMYVAKREKREKRDKKSDKNEKEEKEKAHAVKEEDEKKNGYKQSNMNEEETYTMTESQVIDLSNIDDLTLTELEEMGLAPSREASITPKYLIGGLSRDFPDARALFYNQDALVGAWTNHENHLEMIIQHTLPDLNYVYKKFVDIYVQFRRILKRKEMAWIRHRRLGIVTTSPKHFGTGLTIQCSIRAPNLAKHPKFKRILDKRSLELIQQTEEENEEEDIINLETIHTLGRSEWQIATDLGNALVDLCRMEKALARNKAIDQLI